nr:ATP-grasp domain-containing protein [Aliikangiella sp. G2MR2-5]
MLLTDYPLEHQRYFTREGLPGYPVEILSCDVFNSQAIIELLQQWPQSPAAIFTNSDHLQTSCAQAAEFFNLPAKDWQVCYRAKNKSAMREYLQANEIPTAWFQAITNIAELVNEDIPFPCVVKPQQGVASLDVQRCDDREQLIAFCKKFWRQQPNRSLIIEEFLVGSLFTLETLGDGKRLFALGGFDVTLSAPPYFIETEACWQSDIDSEHCKQALEQLKQFGINFGVCHSEFVLTEQGPRLIEINYRSIGDNREFLLNRLASFDWFKQIMRLHLGEPLDNIEPIKGQAVIRYFCAEQDGKLISLPDEFEQTSPYSIKLEHIRSIGDQIRLSRSNKDYLSILTAVTKDPAPDKLMQALDNLDTRFRWEISA